MKIVVIDAQGGGMGKAFVERMKRAYPTQELICVGTNAIATSAMMKAGGDSGATGENAAAVCAGNADVIVAPIGMVLCDSMLGEVTEKMVLAIGRSRAKKIFLPVSRCQTSIAGLKMNSAGAIIDDAVEKAGKLIDSANIAGQKE